MFGLDFNPANSDPWEWLILIIILLALAAAGTNLVNAIRDNAARIEARENGVRAIETHGRIRVTLLLVLVLLGFAGALIVALGTPPSARASLTLSQAAYSGSIVFAALVLFIIPVADWIDRRRQDHYIDKETK